MSQHYYDDSYDPLECHWCGLNFYESPELHLPLEPGRVVFWSMTGYGRGMCGDREPHPHHVHSSATLGQYWCSGDPDEREPERSRRRWAQ